MPAVLWNHSQDWHDQAHRRAEEAVTLKERIEELVEQHGSLRAAARVIEIDAGYLCRLANGEKVRPGKDFLRKMGIRSVLTYERIETKKP